MTPVHLIIPAMPSVQINNPSWVKKQMINLAFSYLYVFHPHITGEECHGFLPHTFTSSWQPTYNLKQIPLITLLFKAYRLYSPTFKRLLTEFKQWVLSNSYGPTRLWRKINYYSIHQLCWIFCYVSKTPNARKAFFNALENSKLISLVKSFFPNTQN